MSEGERDQLRERVALGVATGEERDRLATLLVRTIRERDAAELDTIDALIEELRLLTSAGSERTSCADALTRALLDAQIRAFERGDAGDAWRRLDEIRARLHAGGPPDLLQDRLAAALYNMIRGGELLRDTPMHLAALEELRTRAYGDPSASACRVALAELLADRVGDAARRGEAQRVRAARAELARLHARDSSLALTRELARAITLLLAREPEDAPALLTELRELAESEQHGHEELRAVLAGGLVTAHVHALRADDEQEAELLREQLRELELHSRGQAPKPKPISSRPRHHNHAAIMRSWGQALHDAAVLGLGREDVDHQDQRLSSTAERAARALAELRVLIHHNEGDLELRGLLMSALFQVHRNAIETGVDDAAEHLQAEADTLLARDDQLHPSPAPRERPLLGRRERDHARRVVEIRAKLRLDHLRMLLATHASAGSRGDWVRAELLLTRARNLVDRAKHPLDMVEVLAQILVNAHVDSGSPDSARPELERNLAAHALLIELRELAASHPHSNNLQLHLATALFNAHIDSSQRRATAVSEELLAELERMLAARPSLSELRRRLVMALVNHHGDCLEREDLFAADEALERLRELGRDASSDEYLCIQLAMALGNALNHIADPSEDEQGQRIVQELRMLAARPDASVTLRTLVLDELSHLFAPRQ